MIEENHKNVNELLSVMRDWAETPESQHDWKGLADRIEAEWKRDIEKERQKRDEAYEYAENVAWNCGGNAAAMREALVKIEKMAHCDLCNVYPQYRDKFNEIIGGIEREARAALSAPPTNSEEYAKPTLFKTRLNKPDGCEICGCTEYEERKGDAE